MHCVNLIGILSVIYSVCIYEKTAFPFRYTVSEVRAVSEGTVEITGKPLDESLGKSFGKPMIFRPGQFTFLKFPKKDGYKFPSHPFTLSSAPQEDMIQITIKNLGDHTGDLVETVRAGDSFAVTAPLGMFDFTAGCRNQVWIAGGIGVTPFRSFYQAGIPDDYSIDFFYGYNNEEAGVYLDELRALKALKAAGSETDESLAVDAGLSTNANLRVHLVDSSKQGYLTAEKIKEQVGTETPVDIYFCGPKPMRDSLMKGLKTSGVRVLNFHYEEFQFGR
jgi:predicted ferric reductase